MVVGYIVMRIALVAQWLRAAREDPRRRAVALRFALGITLIQLGWVIRLRDRLVGGRLSHLPRPRRCSSSPCRPGRNAPVRRRRGIRGHIVERYGLFTIIVLGECVLATTTAVQVAFDAGGVAGAAADGRGRRPAARLRAVVGVLQARAGHRPPPLAADDARLGLRPLLRLRRGRGARGRAPGRGRHDARGDRLGPQRPPATVAVPVAIYLVALAVLHAVRGLGLLRQVLVAIVLVARGRALGVRGSACRRRSS